MSDAAPAASPAEPTPRALRGFALDVGLAVAGLVVLSTAVMLGWAMWIAMREGAAAAQQALAHPPLWLQLVAAGVAMGLPAVLLFAWRRPRSGPRPIRASPRASVAWTLAAGCGVFALSTAVLSLAARAGAQVEPTNAAMLDAGMATAPWAILLFAVALAPVYEELMFRGVLFRRLWSAGHPRLGIALSAATFAVFHEPPGLTDHATGEAAVLLAVYGAMGIVFAWVYRRTGRLSTAVGAHALNNALGTVGVWLGT